MRRLPLVRRKTFPSLKLSYFRGLNNRDVSTSIGDTEAQELLNVDFSRTGSIKKRSGTALVGDDKGNTKVLGLKSVYYGNNSAQQLMASQAASTSGLYYRTTGNWTEATLDAGGTKLANADAEFEDFYDGTNQVTFISDGTKLQKYRASTNTIYDATALPGGADPSAIIRVYKNRLYAVGPGSSLPERVYFSNLGDGDAWTSSDYFDVPSESTAQTGTSGDPITCLAVHQDRLIIFKNRSIWSWDTNRLIQISSNHGCVGKRAFALAENVLYFADNDGVYSLNGNFIQKESKKIQTTWDVIPAARIVEMAMAYYVGKLYIATGAASATNNNIILVLYDQWPVDDEGQHQWSYWKGGSSSELAISVFATYEATTTTLPILTAGLANSQSLIIQLETGTADYDQTAGTATAAINSYYVTKDFNINAQYRQLYATYKSQTVSSLLQVAAEIDFGSRVISNDFQMFITGSSTYGTGVYGTSTYGGQSAIIARGSVPSRGKYIRYRVANIQSSQPYELYELNQIYKPIQLR